jgi:hypothetical protein
MVNILWFSSVDLCIDCAILATLIQEWARRYLSLTQGRATASERERVREFLFIGLTKYRANWVRQSMGILLHVSICLYSLGIVFFLVHVDWELAPFAALDLALSIVMYGVITVLSFLSLRCPYGTPFTPLIWRSYHFFMFGICSGIGYISPGSLEEKAEEHRKRYKSGLKRTIVRCARATDLEASLAAS